MDAGFVSTISEALRGEVDPEQRFDIFMAAAYLKRKDILENTGLGCEAEYVGRAVPMDGEALNRGTGWLFHRASALVNSIENNDLAEYLRRLLQLDCVCPNNFFVIEKLWDLLPDDPEDLAMLMVDLDLERALGPSAQEMTPECVLDLASRILNPVYGETAADFCCGTGSFAVRLALAGVEVDGFEIDGRDSCIASMRNEALGGHASLQRGDMFAVSEKYDKCFSNFPFSVRDFGFKEEALQTLQAQGCSDLPRFGSNDWLFVLQLAERTREGGKATCIVPASRLVNPDDAAIREHLACKGEIEAVVLLPAGLFPRVKGETAMLVLSQGNESCSLVDARNYCTRARGVCEMNASHIDEVMALLADCKTGMEMDDAFLAHRGDMEAEAFSLYPPRYLSGHVDVHNGVPLKDVARVFRGTSWGKSELVSHVSQVPTDTRYLELRGIEDGHVGDDLPYLVDVDASQDRYMLKTGDVVISKVGPNFKIALVEVPEGQRILASGNLYVIRPDPEVIEPLYLKGCLESPQGMKQLKRASSGSSVISLPRAALDSEVLIPLVRRENQQKYVRSHRELEESILEHMKAIEQDRKKLADLIYVAIYDDLYPCD